MEPQFVELSDNDRLDHQYYQICQGCKYFGHSQYWEDYWPIGGRLLVNEYGCKKVDEIGWDFSLDIIECPYKTPQGNSLPENPEE